MSGIPGGSRSAVHIRSGKAWRAIWFTACSFMGAQNLKSSKPLRKTLVALTIALTASVALGLTPTVSIALAVALTAGVALAAGITLAAGIALATGICVCERDTHSWTVLVSSHAPRTPHPTRTKRTMHPMHVHKLAPLCLATHGGEPITDGERSNSAFAFGLGESLGKWAVESTAGERSAVASAASGSDGPRS